VNYNSFHTVAMEFSDSNDSKSSVATSFEFTVAVRLSCC